ncbi:MAG: NUDIX domain-containing protein, partial [Bacteroidota bacterium]
TRHFNFLRLEKDGQVLIEKRQQQDIWKGLYQFPLIETSTLATEQQLSLHPILQHVSYKINKCSKPFKQTLSHQYIVAHFWEIQLHSLPSLPKYTQAVPNESLRQYAFPKVIDWYLKDNSLYLNLI